jgi:hypothetical protein
MQITKQSLMQRTEENRKNGFERWMASAPTRLLISQIPCGDQTQSETFQVLLRSAYDNGFGCGEVTLGMEMLTSMLTKKSD